MAAVCLALNCGLYVARALGAGGGRGAWAIAVVQAAGAACFAVDAWRRMTGARSAPPAGDPHADD